MTKLQLIAELRLMGLNVLETDKYKDLLRIYKEEREIDKLFDIVKWKDI
jgi:hypothetical protein